MYKKKIQKKTLKETHLEECHNVSSGTMNPIFWSQLIMCQWRKSFWNQSNAANNPSSCLFLERWANDYINIKMML